jgi:RNA polymerase sigma factor (sigma-70 family)
VDRDLERALDEYLVSLSQAGSIEALDRLARRWTPRVLRYATRVLGGSGDAVETARDVVQDTWIGVIRGLRGLRDPAQFPAWIYGIATRKCADTIRKRKRRRRLDADVVAVDAREPVASLTISEQQIDLANAIRAPGTPRSCPPFLSRGPEHGRDRIGRWRARGDGQVAPSPRTRGTQTAIGRLCAGAR